MKHIKVICDMSWPIKNLLYCLVCGMAKGGEGRKKEIGMAEGRNRRGWKEIGRGGGKKWEGMKEEFGRGRRKRGILMAVKNN